MVTYICLHNDVELFHFFQSLNFDITRAYLDLIVTYVSLMILIARVEDRKAVLGLFNYAYETLNGRRFIFFKYVTPKHFFYMTNLDFLYFVVMNIFQGWVN